MACVKNKVKLYRHSTTFYRKVKHSLSLKRKEKYFNEDRELSSIKQTSGQLNPLHFLPAAKSFISETTNDEFLDVCLEENMDYSEEELDKNSDSRISLLEDLRKWALVYKVPHTSINELLSILNKSEHINLPKDSRTLLHTPNFINVVPMGAGTFWYNGIKNCLMSAFSFLSEPILISLLFNIDGIPPFKSSGMELWPILFSIDSMPNITPMVVAIFFGKGKPPLDPFLCNFVEELNDVLDSGVFVNSYKITVKIKCFVCDTPARSFIKGTVGFNATHGCIKCTVIGDYDKKGRHMSFPRIDCPRRTNENFRNQSDSDHHKCVTPLLKLPFDIVEDIIVSDSLHLLDLGVMRKCLYGWISGSYNFRTKLSAREIDLLSDMLEECNTTKPAEIHRSIRRLNFCKYWKGVEYRTFLLYLGPVVLKNFLSTKAYEHYLVLFCAVTIVSCKYYLKYIHVADQLFQDYIQQFIEIYGIDSISMNIHNLCHVIEDVKKFGHLPLMSSYSFESFLGHIKSLLRGGNRPLSQIAKRLLEISKLDKIKEDNINKSRYINCNKVQLGNSFLLANDNKNKWFMAKNGDIVSMLIAKLDCGRICIKGTPVKKKEDFFYLPIKSSRLNIYKTSDENDLPKYYFTNDIKCKLFCLKYESKNVFFPLLHTLDLIIE